MGLFPLNQWSPTFLAPGTDFMEDNFSMDIGQGKVVMWALGSNGTLLTSCCAAQFWTGWGRLVHGLGVGDPCPKWLSRSLRVFVYLSFPWTVSLPSWLLSLADVCSWPNCDEGLSPLGPHAPYWLQTPELRSRFPPPLPVSAAGSSPGRGDPPLLLWLSLSSTSLHGSWASCHMATPHHNGHVDEMGPRWIWGHLWGSLLSRSPWKTGAKHLPPLTCVPTSLSDTFLPLSLDQNWAPVPSHYLPVPCLLLMRS